MKQELILERFETLIQNLSIDLRYEQGDFIGGLCRVGSRDVLIINSKLPVNKKINVIANELSRLNLRQIYIRPLLRDIIEGNKF